jgi:CDP-glucose 4,6-dehydratase
MIDVDFWSGKRVLVTGHTGFKGSWLCLWLQSLGCRVAGLSQEPATKPALYEEARVSENMASYIGDIRDFATVQKVIGEVQPEVVFHLAAQALVRQSYKSPVETYATNVLGTVHVLEASRHVGTVKSVVIVTTDKCYDNREWVWGYRETDPMGGHDPYSSSKGCAELVTNAYRNSFFDPEKIALASARAGNVIGGGDWAVDRLLPDILNSFAAGARASIRNPEAVRPWQFVLEPISGYLELAHRQFIDTRFAGGWNFGPEDQDARRVDWIVNRMATLWGEGAAWEVTRQRQLHEATQLRLDISKARNLLGWKPVCSLERTLELTVAWHRAWMGGKDMQSVSLDQISQYSALRAQASHVI